MHLDYELIDTGDGERLERYGSVLLRRPDPQIIWKKHLPDGQAGAPELWDDVHAHFDDDWKIQKTIPDAWIISFGEVRFRLQLTAFKHTGVFPEQEENWLWMLDKLQKPSRILNLFAYTGAASMILAKAGHHVTHVDSSKPSLDWAAENQKLSGLASDSIRWMLEDAVKFVKREVKRGSQYEGILLDPPAFGHGPTGNIWKFNRDLPGLLRDCKALLSPDARFLLVNGYATNSSSIALNNLLEDIMKSPIQHGELLLKQRDGRAISTGIFARWSAK